MSFKIRAEVVTEIVEQIIHELDLVDVTVEDRAEKGEAEEVWAGYSNDANEEINSISFDRVSGCWLRLYVDSTIGYTASQIILQTTTTSEEPADDDNKDDWLKCVRKLDLAIIVAGGAGPRRKKMILDLIKLIQVAYLGHRKSHVFSRLAPTPRARARSPPAADAVRPRFAPRPIPESAGAPSIEQYLTDRRLLNRPFVIRGQCRDWPAVDLWSDSAYLMQSVGPGRVVPVEIGSSYTEEGWGQKIVPFQGFLHHISHATHQDNIVTDQSQSLADLGIAPSDPLYLAQHSLFEQFPDLEEDFYPPELVYSNPPSTSTYSPPGNAEQLITNVWIGSGDLPVISPAHTDPYYNCYTQVIGSKRVWVAPPECAPYMHTYAAADQSEEDRRQLRNTETSTEHTDFDATAYMSNTSRVPIFDGATSDGQAYADFEQHVRPLAMETVLKPGDLLVMPPGWWHTMRSEGQGISWSISMWY